VEITVTVKILKSEYFIWLCIRTYGSAAENVALGVSRK